MPTLLLVASSLALASDHGGGPGTHWSYDGDTGPDHWGELSSDYASCAQGRAQTPIGVETHDAVSLGLDEPIFHYTSVEPTLLNNGHTLQANLGAGSWLEVDGRRFDLLQFHVHTPSEHELDGTLHDMELHLVHRDDEGHLAVVGILLDAGGHTVALDALFDAATLEVGGEQKGQSSLNPAGLLPSDHELVRYSGSLTTPPCTEGVRWLLMTHPMYVSRAQVSRFQELYAHNSRPLQGLNGRELLTDATP